MVGVLEAVASEAVCTLPMVTDGVYFVIDHEHKSPHTEQAGRRTPLLPRLMLYVFCGFFFA